VTATNPEGLADLLRAWLPDQRWYAGKGSELSEVRVLAAEALPTPPDAGNAELHHVLVATRTGAGEDRYQMVVGLRRELPERLGHVAIGTLPDGRTAYDGVWDGELTPTLARLLVEQADVGTLRFRRVEGAELDPGASSRVMGAEQSNTSLVFGDRVICKLFRRVAPGRNPDLELTLALTEAGTRHIAPVLAWVEADLEGQETTLAMVQEFLPSGTEGWALATASVRDLFAEGDLHADEVGGDFAAESERLGLATAQVHADLARVLPSSTTPPHALGAMAQQMKDRLEAAVAVVAELHPYAERLRSAYDEVAGLSTPMPVQRIHGDYHLGQVLRTDAGWVLLDFEGEPARPLSERVAPMSPLRDVAGMLRSYDYAARHLLAERGGDGQLAYRANEWAERNRSAFCDGYAQGSGRDPREESVLLRAFELDKAVYEVVYEARSRPSWLPIPLGSVERLVG
jgi:maltokinase